ncbi:hypothetical protein [Spirosoma aerolatum]|uniref:hypothetical protein n=1 Tax=Spirosoma aerolatum TaxID=1211326 RepID=UPI0009AE2984|nr:hypothetical protein [Spirosoma aerolatum]
MATLGDLYRQAEAMRNQRIGQQSKEVPSYALMREIDDLKRIMDGLLLAFKQAGGSKAPDPEKPN